MDTPPFPIHSLPHGFMTPRAKVRFFVLLTFFLMVVGSGAAHAQTFSVSSPLWVKGDGSTSSDLLYLPDHTIRVSWSADLGITGATLFVGTSASTVAATSVRAQNNQVQFTPESIGLGVGAYAGVIVSDTGRFSAPFPIFVESPKPSSVRVVRDEKGDVSEKKPRFVLSRPSGVPAVYLQLSSTPFDIEENEDGELTATGATATWGILTSDTELVYGQTNPEVRIASLNVQNYEAPPLEAGKTYYYTALNAYDPTIGPISSVIGSVESFVYAGDESLTSPSLIAPADNADLQEETVAFTWDPVENATSYKVNIYRREEAGGNSLDIAELTLDAGDQTILTADVARLFVEARYLWEVIATDDQGNQSVSERRVFNVSKPSIEVKFRVYERTAAGQEPVQGVSIDMYSQAGIRVDASTPNSNVRSVTVPLGTWEWYASKAGYSEARGGAQLTVGTSSPYIADVYLERIPVRLSAQLNANGGPALKDVTLTLVSTDGRLTFTPQVSVAGSTMEALLDSRVPGRTYDMIVAIPGYETIETEVRIPTGTDRLQLDPIDLQPSVVRIEGRLVNDAGEPVPYSYVVGLQQDDAGGIQRQRARSSQDGSFSMILSAGTMTLRNANAIYFAEDLELVGSAGETLSPTLVLSPKPLRLSGTVYFDDSTEDVAGLSLISDFEVVLTPQTGNPIVLQPSRRGFFEVTLPSTLPARYDVQITELVTGTRITSPPQDVSFHVQGQQRQLAFILPREEATATVSGRILDYENGEPLPGARVIARRKVGPSWVWMRLGTTTDQDGRYVLRLPARTPQSYRISVSVAGHYVLNQDQEIGLSVGQRVEQVDFLARPRASEITGKVIDQNNNVVREATVMAIREGGSVDARESVTVAGGAFRMALPAGRYDLRVQKLFYQLEAPVSVVLSSGSRSSGNVIRVTDVSTLLQGRTEPGARIEAVAIGADEDLQGVSFVDKAASDGNFSLRVVGGHAYRVRVSKPGFFSTSFTTDVVSTNRPFMGIDVGASDVGVSIGKAGAVDVTLQPAPTLLSGVVETRPGQPAVGSWVVAKSGGSSIDSTLTDVDGAYVLGLAQGAYTIEARTPGYISEGRSVSLTTGENLSGIGFQQRPARGTLAGQVTDEQSGQPLANVLVSASGIQGGSSGRSDERGQYVIPDLYPGVYSVSYSGTGLTASVRTDVRVEADATQQSDRGMRVPSGRVSGVLTSVDGASLADADVTLTHESGRVYAVRSASDGAYEADMLPLGAFEIMAEKPGWTRQGLQVTALTEDQSTRMVDFSDFAAAASVVFGTVTDAQSGTALRGVTVSLSGAAGSASTETNAAGQYTLDNLPDGTYEVSFSLDGFLSEEGSLMLSAGQSVQQDRSLTRSQGRLYGQVTDQSGASTGYIIDVVATSTTGRFTAKTSTAGAYAIADLPAGTYRVSTAASREGFTNVSENVTIQPSDADVSLDLMMTVGTARITGSANQVGVRVELIDPRDNTLVKSTTSTSQADFSFRNLLPGTYRIVPSLEGYVFTPSSIEVAVTNAAEQSASFSAVENLGTVRVQVNDETGNPVSDALVRALSSSGEVNTARTTDASGGTLFSLEAGLTYFFSAQADGRIASAAAPSRAVAAGSAASVTLVMIPANGSVTGSITRAGGGPITGALITLTNTSGQDVATVQEGSSYTLEGLAPGQYTVQVTASGYRAVSQTISIDPGEQRSGLDFALQSLSARITGRVVSSAGGQADVKVVMQGIAERSTMTDSDGRFTIDEVPVPEGGSETTVYSILVSGEGILPQSSTISLAADQIGSTVTLPDILIPSGKIDVLITDGSAPLADVSVRLISARGQLIEGATDASGRFSTGRSLPSGAYQLSITATGRMAPVSTTAEVTLETDISEISTTVPLPYVFVPPEDVFAAEETPVRISVPAGFSTEGKEASLRFQFDGDATTTVVPMSADASGFVAFIPALYNLDEVTFATHVTDTETGIQYRSRTITTLPSGAGVLTQSRVTPALGGIPLRIGDAYDARIILRDGAGNPLTEEFIAGGAGQLQWTASDPSLVVTVAETDPTRILIEPGAAGTFSLTVSAQLGGAFTTSSTTLDVTDAPVSALTVTTGSQRATNTDAGYPLSVTATLEDGSVVRLGQALTWSVTPSAAARVEASTIVFSEPGFFGPMQVEAIDEVSSQREAATIDVLVPIDGSTSFSLTNLAGLEFDIPQGAVPVPAMVGLAPQRLPVPKRSARIGEDTYQVEEPVFNMTLEAEQAIPGDSLQVGASLTMPLLSNRFASLNEGERRIGFFDVGRIQWQSLETNLTGGMATASLVYRLGEFAILSANEPLGIRHAVVLPSPFSPDIAPLKIGYLLQSAAPPAVVDIEIFSLMGERVRTLLDGEVQQPGRYGSSTSLRPIEWDGMTDAGHTARNGRYVVRITAKDASGEVSELIPVVLVK